MQVSDPIQILSDPDTTKLRAPPPHLAAEGAGVHVLEVVVLVLVGLEVHEPGHTDLINTNSTVSKYTKDK